MKNELPPDRCAEFRSLVEGSENAIDLGRAALAIARIDYPDLNLDSYLSRIDALALAVSRRMESGATSYHSIATLNYVLFQEQGFCGNRENYFDPKNSFLNQVLERKTGIPITLSVLYMLVAKRVGLHIRGVGFPGHFLVKYSDDDGEIVIDPFNGGEIRSAGDLQSLLHNLHGAQVTFHPRLLAAATTKEMLQRLLRNLKIIYLNEKQLLKSVAVLDRLLILDPSSADDLRARAMVSVELECFAQALADFENYLRFYPTAPDARLVRRRIDQLSKQVRQIH